MQKSVNQSNTKEFQTLNPTEKPSPDELSIQNKINKWVNNKQEGKWINTVILPKSSDLVLKNELTKIESYFFSQNFEKPIRINVKYIISPNTLNDYNRMQLCILYGKILENLNINQIIHENTQVQDFSLIEIVSQLKPLQILNNTEYFRIRFLSQCLINTNHFNDINQIFNIFLRLRDYRNDDYLLHRIYLSRFSFNHNNITANFFEDSCNQITKISSNNHLKMINLHTSAHRMQCAYLTTKNIHYKNISINEYNKLLNIYKKPIADKRITTFTEYIKEQIKIIESN